MDKLIVVGMRFEEDQEPLKWLKTGDRLKLVTERSDKGVNGWAVRVYNYAELPVGFIRNQDLPGFLRMGAKTTCMDYVVEAIRTNYILLKRSTFKTSTTDNHIDNHPALPAFKSVIKEATELKKESKEMINTNSMRNQFFREVKNVAIDIQSGKFGIVSTDGISVYDNGAINVNPIQELGVKIPAFAMRIAVDQLKAGDIVINGDTGSFFVEAVKEGGYKVISTSGEVSVVGNVKNMFFGSNTVLAVKNMFDGTGMNPLMMAMFMGEGNGTGKMDMKTLALMSMMGGQSGGGFGDMNPMMLMLMMGDK